MTEINKVVENFRIEETKKWQKMSEDQGILKCQIAEHIVVPSGSWTAKLSHQLHVPSFTTLKIRNGETADSQSPCTRMILDNGFDHRTHFMYDHFHRRESLSPFTKYPSHIRSIHEKHTTWIRKTIHAKIEIIYGRIIQKWAEKNLQLSNLHLWGEYKDTWLFFEWEKSEDHETRISRIIIFASHPQRFLSYNLRSNPEAAIQDQLVTCACKLAGLPSRENFYSSRPWMSKANFIHITSIKFLGKAEADKSDTIATTLSARAAKQSPDEEALKGSDTTIMSLQRLYSILQELLESSRGSRCGNRQFRDRYKHISINENDFLSSLPSVLHEWIKGQQKHFLKRLVQKPADLIPAYLQFCTSDSKPSSSTPIPEPMEILLALMNFQQKRLASERAHHGYQSRSQMFSTFETVPLACEMCSKPVEPDTLPRFSLDDPEIYLMRLTKCNSKSCHGLQRNGRPINGLEFGTIRNLRGNGWENLLRSSDDCEGLPSEVELWCKGCKESTVLARFHKSDNEEKTSERVQTALDPNPRWTLGDRPKYVPRYFLCKNCPDKSVPFVPVNNDIPFTTKRKLEDTMRRFSYMDLKSLLKVLDAFGSSSYTPHKSKRKLEILTEENDNGSDTVNIVDLQVCGLMITDPQRPAIIQLKCLSCNEECAPDLRPRFHAVTGQYIAFNKKRCPKWCTIGKKVWFVPVDETPWVRSKTVYSQQHRARDSKKKRQ